MLAKCRWRPARRCAGREDMVDCEAEQTGRRSAGKAIVDLDRKKEEGWSRERVAMLLSSDQPSRVSLGFACEVELTSNLGSRCYPIKFRRTTPSL